MIPIYRSTLTRLDLSSVLSYMVENVLEGETAGHVLTKEIADWSSYRGGVALRSPLEAVTYALDFLKTETVLLPVLAPPMFASYLERIGKEVIFYDVDAETMSPILHEGTQIPYEKKLARVGMSFFGGVVKDNDALPKEFLDISKIEIRQSFNKSLYHIEDQKKKKKKSEIEDEEHTEEQGVDDNVTMDDDKPPFCVMLMENNTLCTAGGGALLLVRDKAHQKALKSKKNIQHEWALLTDFNASLALAQFKQIGEFVARVDGMQAMYNKAIQRTRHSCLPIIRYDEAVPQCFPVLVHSRVNEVVKYINKQGVDYEFPFQHSSLGMMLEDETCNKEEVLEKYPHASKFVTNLITLPLYPALDNEEISRVVQVISTLP